jgi:hypothetical protein
MAPSYTHSISMVGKVRWFAVTNPPSHQCHARVVSQELLYLRRDDHGRTALSASITIHDGFARILRVRRRGTPCLDHAAPQHPYLHVERQVTNRVGGIMNCDDIRKLR